MRAIMYCIGLTGTIASGKTTVSKLFSEFEITIISADQIAKQLTQPEQTAFADIVSHFGKRICQSDGTLDRYALRQSIFQNPEEREWLECLLHPLIRAQIAEHVLHVTSPYCVIEIPLLNNKTEYPYLDRVLVIEADQTIKIKRIMTRDHCSEEHALSILNTQAREASYRALADDVVLNNGTDADLRQKVEQLHKDYLGYAQSLCDTEVGTQK